MKEHPIIFSGAMVRAILEGRKTQTRRVVKPQPTTAPRNAASTPHWFTGGLEFSRDQSWRCPYGAPGDRLWVRETWKPTRSHLPGLAATYVRYAADDERREIVHEMGGSATDRRRPSIHMPRWASRLLLEVVNIRVQRVQEINAEDSLAEGVPRASECGCEVCRHSAEMCPADASEQVLAFAHLWDSINGKRAPWESNPWVWAITFRRVE